MNCQNPLPDSSLQHRALIYTELRALPPPTAYAQLPNPPPPCTWAHKPKIAEQLTAHQVSENLHKPISTSLPALILLPSHPAKIYNTRYTVYSIYIAFHHSTLSRAKKIHHPYNNYLFYFLFFNNSNNFTITFYTMYSNFPPKNVTMHYEVSTEFCPESCNPWVVRPVKVFQAVFDSLNIANEQQTLPTLHQPITCCLFPPHYFQKPYVKHGGRSPKFIWAPCHVMCTAVLIGSDRNSPPPPYAFVLVLRGRFWSAKI